jgi:gliding motility-associated-like protein
LGNDTSICEGQDIIITPSTNTTAAYLWQVGSTALSYDVKDTGIYKLTISNECGSATSSVEISEGVCELYIASAFTPDGDGINDVFGIKYPFAVRQFDMSIYNRWGEKISESNDMSKGWDGTFNGVNQNTEVYIWMISFIDSNNAKKFAQGTVT